MAVALRSRPAAAAGACDLTARAAPRHAAARRAGTAAAPTRARRRTCPTCPLADRDGEPRGFDHWRGRSLIVNFWATWCAPCRREIPLLEQLQASTARTASRSSASRSTSATRSSRTPTEMKIDYPAADRRAGGPRRRGRVRGRRVGLPFTVFADAQGRIIAAHIGRVDGRRRRT